MARAVNKAIPSRVNFGSMTDDALLARVLYRDGLMLVLDKPAGIAVHPGPGGGPNLESHFNALRFGLPRPPHLAHRLDRDTAGCLVLGRHPKALRRLGKLFAAGQVEKVYWAVVEGAPAEETGRIDLPLHKVTNKTGWRMVVDPAMGQPAITDWKVLGRGPGLTWLELRPRTGRTHQIRIHCAAMNWPLLGDPQYAAGGISPAQPPTLPLHLLSQSIVLPLYPKKPPVEVRAPVPDHMKQALQNCGWDSDLLN